MAARPGDPPVLLVKWYDLTMWLLERVQSFPKSRKMPADSDSPRLASFIDS